MEAALRSLHCTLREWRLAEVTKGGFMWNTATHELLWNLSLTKGAIGYVRDVDIWHRREEDLRSFTLNDPIAHVLP